MPLQKRCGLTCIMQSRPRSVSCICCSSPPTGHSIAKQAYISYAGCWTLAPTTRSSRNAEICRSSRVHWVAMASFGDFIFVGLSRCIVGHGVVGGGSPRCIMGHGGGGEARRRWEGNFAASLRSGCTQRRATGREDISELQQECASHPERPRMFLRFGKPRNRTSEQVRQGNIPGQVQRCFTAEQAGIHFHPA